MAKKPEIAIEPDEVPKDQPEFVVEDTSPAQETASGAKTAELSPEEGIEDLKRKLAAETAARQAAERHAYMQAQQAAGATRQVDNSNLALVNGSLEQHRGASSMLKEKYAQAAAAGDHALMADINEQMMGIHARIQSLEAGRMQLEQQARQPQPQIQPPPVDIAAGLVQTLAQNGAPRSAEWVARNRHLVGDQRGYQKLMAAHSLAVANGVIPETDEYFEEIAKTMEPPQRREAPVQQQEAAQPIMSAASAPVQRRSSPPAAAPVTRNGATGNPRVIRLSEDQKEAARISGLTPEEYARNMVAAETRRTTH